MSGKTTSISLTPLMAKEMKALVKTGRYSSRSDLIRDAFRVYLENKPSTKIAIAIELYKEEKISLTRAAEIAGLDIEGFKEILKDREIKLKTYTGTHKEMKEGMKKT